ncbi:ABC transporter ATP-binding protein [Polynucleobacter paneuropaeus]|nr:ABC transporter ATP-binding protein [Polynucleobacter paneuropaeus]
MTSTQELPKLIKALWQHLSRCRKYQFVALLGMMLISTFTEVVSLGAVLPFMAALTEPERVFAYPLVASMARTWGITSADQLVLPLTIAFGLAALAAGVIRLLLLWVSARVAYASASDLSIEVYRKTLFQPYSVHLLRNSSQVISSITHQVNEVAFGVLLSLPALVSSLLLLIAILCTLMVINPVVASVAGLGFGASYILITFLSRHRLRRDGQRIAQGRAQIIKALQESLGSIRDVILDGTQSVFCNIYRNIDAPLRKAQGNNLFISVSPRYAMEALGMMLIAVLAYQLSRQPGGVATALPILGALALGAQRLLPALQQIYSSWTSIFGNQAALAAVVNLLEQPMPEHSFQSDLPFLEFRKTITFQRVGFSYANDEHPVLNDLNLTIFKGSRIGIIGSTGSGKSTLIDLLMGLLKPTYGDISVDDLPITDLNRQSWQRMIAHVPQSIYLTDTTVAENIAFGVPFIEIDMERVQLAAQQAQIDSFIESRPNGYQSLLGERGVYLSGGQRQRIGIARALYKQASILVFDEATSALDGKTEQEVMRAIEGLSKHLTILIIAHRLTTLKNCTQIVELSEGRIKRTGTYQDIIELNA